MDSVIAIKRILQSFQLLSGLKINFNKSSLYSCSKDEKKIKKYVQILGCKKGSWPLNFLGDQIDLSSIKKTFWVSLIQKFKEKLASWKKDTLNQAGRLSLIKSTINSLPVYWFSLHKVPVGVCKKMETTIKDFFWENINEKGEISKKKMSLLAWDKICTDRKHGGLGLAPFRHKNSALMCKWFYKWQNKKIKGWNVWLRSKYGCSKSTELIELTERMKGSKVSRFLLELLHTSQYSQLGEQMHAKKFCGK